MADQKLTVGDIVIGPNERVQDYWRDLWRYRELFLVLTWRDIAVRYKQTVIGVAWAVVRPVATILILTVVFNRMIKLTAPGAVPYPLLVFAGMLPWQFVSTALSDSSSSLIGNANLISKVYFPRLIIPAASVFSSLVDFAITFVLMMFVMIGYGFVPDWRFVATPLFSVLAVGVALGAGLWFGALHVKYRDFRHIVPFIVQFGLYASPVGFSSAIVPQRWRLLYDCNPMVGIIEGFRWALLRGQSSLDWIAVTLSVVVVSLLCASGFWYFRKTEEVFADVI